jgi:hypothetical protein
MTKARNLSNLLDATGDVVSTALDNVPPSDNASSLTTGTLAIDRLANGSITSVKLGNDAKVVKSATAPSTPVEGDLWYDTVTEVLKIYSNTESSFLKVVRIIPTLDSISGNIINATAGNLTLTGAGFLASNLIVSFTPSGGSASTVTVTPTNDTTATVAVPSAIYNQSINTVIGIKVTNTDLKSSSTVNKTVADLPSGGTISNSGSYRIHTFTSSGTFTNTLSLTNVEYLVIAGGGGGGGRHAGGGGAGGYRSSVVGENSGGGASAESTQTLGTGSYTVTVGAGGAGGAGNAGSNAVVGQQGSNSVFNGITSIGGGGGHNDGDTTAFVDGGSGGGGTYETTGAGSGTAGQGFDGGQGTNASPTTGSGGGGASEAGQSQNSSKGGDGGDGVSSSITGSAITRAGGGGGGKDGGNNGTAGSGGAGGGTDGGGGSALTDASANTGGGGGGYGGGLNGDGTRGANGGSGVVIVRYQL